MKKKISAIIAHYQCSEAIPVLHERLTQTFNEIGCDYSLIWVNDSPNDIKSSAILKELSKRDSHVIIIEHSRPFGSQNAFTSGMEWALENGADAVVLMDNDCQDPPELIKEFYAKWKEGYDIVYGTRAKRDGPWIQEFLAKIFYKVFNKLSYVNVPLNAGDFSLISRRCAEEICAMPEQERFLRGMRAYIGFKSIGVEYVRPERISGKSTNNLRKNIDWAKRGILSFSFIPLELMTYAGVLTTFIAFLGIIWQIAYHFMNPTAAPGFSTLIILTLLLGGLNLLAVSVVGEYVGKIFAEVKQRPKFIRRAVIRNGVEVAQQ